MSEVYYARIAEKRVLMESFHTRVAPQPKLFNNLGHVDALVLIGAPAPMLSVHRAQEIRKGRILRRRRHELEALFVPEQEETEHRLQDGVASGRYPRTSSLFCENYEV